MKNRDFTVHVCRNVNGDFVNNNFLSKFYLETLFNIEATNVRKTTNDHTTLEYEIEKPSTVFC